MDPTRTLRIQSRSKPTPRRNALLILVIIPLSIAAAHAQSLPNLVSTVIRGSSVYTSPELFPVYSPHIGKPITNESARAIATALADMYVADGFSRPGISIDDRMVGVGVLAIEVVETRIAAVEITGDPGPYARRLEALGQTLDAAGPLRSQALQTAVRRMRALPGLSLTASTERLSEPPVGYRLSIDTDYQPVSGVVRVTNRGTDEIGPQFVLGQITANGMLGGRASIGLGFGSATDFSEYHGAGLNGRASLTDDDLVLVATSYRSRSDPNETPVNRNDRYLRDRLTLGTIKTLHGAGGVQIALTTGLRAEDLGIFRDRSVVRDERLRLVEVGMRWTARLRPTSQFAAGFELVKGVNGAGSGLRAVDLPADPRVPDFLLASLDFARVAVLQGQWSWRLNSLAQWSRDTVPYSERFKIGGDRLGRGFEVTEIAGDRGVGAKLEFLRRLPAVSERVGVVSVYSFYDIAAAWKNDAPGRESAATAGVGILLNGSRTSGRIEVAKPLTHPDVEGRSDPRLFLEVSVTW